jgi:Phage integrase family
VLLIGFAALMIAAGIRMLGEQVPLGGNCALRGCLPRASGSGLAVGFLTGLFGVGGGFLIIPALTSLTIADLHLGDGPHVRCHGKGRKERATPLTRQTLAMLRAWMRERSGAATDPVFPTRQEHPLSVDAIWLPQTAAPPTPLGSTPQLRQRSIRPCDGQAVAEGGRRTTRRRGVGKREAARAPTGHARARSGGGPAPS